MLHDPLPLNSLKTVHFSCHVHVKSTDIVLPLISMEIIMEFWLSIVCLLPGSYVKPISDLVQLKFGVCDLAVMNTKSREDLNKPSKGKCIKDIEKRSMSSGDYFIGCWEPWGTWLRVNPFHAHHARCTQIV